jgi:transposase
MRRGPKRGPANQALGKSQGGWSTKVHLRAEGQGKPLTILLTPGQRHESTQFRALLDQGAVKRVGRGRPKLRPRRIVGDKGYSSRANREAARRRRMRVTIPHKVNERRGPFDRVAYRQRNRIERLINRFKHCRRLATRYEKCGDNYRAMWVIAAILLWL